MPQPAEILLVEDNPADVDLTKESLEDSRIHVQLHTVGDGMEALEFLHREGAHAAAPRPDLVLLDLNLPGCDGRDVLSTMKTDPTLRRIPVVVLTSSEAESDVVRAYDLGANCYVKKPLNLAQFEVIVRSIEGFWFSVVKLPPE